ncbi:MAG TPA: hypothetical protein P5182_11305 [Myxococcota bacterium]|nr:hypothetical protein [Myxococcota bacterium]HRR75015.1 hypothetical protein [Myxococcota bacterium]
MKYGIQVNIGPPGAPDWRWLQQHDMSSGEWDSKDKATAKMLEWHPNPMKAHLFRVHEIDENP